MDTRLPKWANLMLLAIVSGIFYLIIQILAAPAAQAEDNIPTQPQLILPTVTDLQNQANAWVDQKQSELTNVVEDARKGAETVLAPLMQPAPAVIPAAPPVPTQPVLISPEIDQTIVNALPASLPELTQQLVDLVFEAGLSTILGVPATMPEIERMDKSAPLAAQVEAAVDLFRVKDVVPDMNACGGESIEAKAACGAAIIADNTPGDQPVAKVNLVSRYGVEAWITPWGSVCGGYISSMAYCGEIYASKNMFYALAADYDNPTQGEVTLVLAHENQHSRDATTFKNESDDVFKYGPGVFTSGPGAFFAHTKKDTANEFHYEQRADSGGMTVVRSAVSQGQLPPEAVDQGYALLGRIGYTMPDGSSEPTHGSSRDRIAAGGRDIEEFDKGDAALLAAA